MSEWIRWILTLAACGVALLAATNAKDTAGDTEVLICSTARLIAFVPAIQFEGEPLDNFIGWTESRRDMLRDIRQRDLCTTEIQTLMEKRVQLDEALLKELKKE